ncbi:MAG TPA: 50S ribosomal protein L11 methyltransferase [Clostridia bacterium]|nr:50S ribosomal protein L11 methyltransferase [Clostridia bacterium]
MKWYEITINTTSEGSELVADAFFSVGLTGGVKILDKNDILDIIKNSKSWDYIDEELLQEDPIVKVSGFVSKEEVDNKIDEIKEALDAYNVQYGEITVSEVDDTDWYDNWKRYYKPIDADKFVIVPKWMNYTKDDGKIVIYMDPGMAFGTGEHESTRLCLKLMSKIDFTGKNVIDVGTGSGILGIGAIKAGAKTCYMCDIDSIAVKAAKENALLNKVGDKAEIELADLLTKTAKKGDIVLANLTANILNILAKDLPRYTEKGGILICSGIIHPRKEEVIAAYTAAGFSLVEDIAMGEWDGLMFRF